MDGPFVQVWQDPDALHAEFSPRGTSTIDGRSSGMLVAGWNPPDSGHVLWWRSLDWPATAADYRALAAGIVAVLRDVFGLGAPTELTYTAWSVGGAPLVVSGFSDIDRFTVTYYARLGPGDTPERPKGLLRRTHVGIAVEDEALGRDGEWHPTETLELAELGELGDDLVPVTQPVVDEIVAWWRRGVDRQGGDGEPPLRMAAAVDVQRDAGGRPVLPGPRLVEPERSAVATYLREAPTVAVAWGYDVDPFDPDRPEVVPLHLHTDGQWAWSESLAYFAQRYGVPPEAEFLEHIRGQRYQWPDLDDEELLRLSRRLAQR